MLCQMYTMQRFFSPFHRLSLHSVNYFFCCTEPFHFMRAHLATIYVFSEKNLSIIIMTINGLNIPIKRHRIADWMKKQNLCICSH